MVIKVKSLRLLIIIRSAFEIGMGAISLITNKKRPQAKFGVNSNMCNKKECLK